MGKYGGIKLIEGEILDYFIMQKFNMTEISKKINYSIQSIKKTLNFYNINTSSRDKPKSEVHKKRLSQNARINPDYGMKGKHFSDKTKRKMSKLKLEYYKKHGIEDKLGENNPMWKVNRPKEWRENQRKVRSLQIFPIKDTKIEIKIQNLLSQLHLEYIAHKYISEITHAYQCDILIPVQEGIAQKIIIEADGCYWHGCPICKLDITKKIKEQKERDEIRTKELIEKGFKVIRLKEHNIKVMKLQELKNVLMVYI